MAVLSWVGGHIRGESLHITHNHAISRLSAVLLTFAITQILPCVCLIFQVPLFDAQPRHCSWDDSQVLSYSSVIRVERPMRRKTCPIAVPKGFVQTSLLDFVSKECRLQNLILLRYSRMVCSLLHLVATRVERPPSRKTIKGRRRKA